MDRAIPKSLYRYQSFAYSYSNESVENIIRANTCYWACPRSYNDPFDCNPNFILGANPSEAYLHARKIAKSDKSAPRQVRLARAKATVADGGKVMLAGMRENWLNYISETRVLCVSEDGESPVLWGHYADKHEGICFEFDLNEIDDPIHVPWKVNYVENRVNINIAAITPDSLMRDSVLQKSDQWKYEQEWRLIAWRRPDNLRAFNSKCLKSVILGMNIKDEHEAFVRGLLKARPEVRLRRAEMSALKFKMNIVDL